MVSITLCLHHYFTVHLWFTESGRQPRPDVFSFLYRTNPSYRQTGRGFGPATPAGRPDTEQVPHILQSTGSWTGGQTVSWQGGSLQVSGYMSQVSICCRWVGICYRWVGICYRWVGICYRWVGMCYRLVGICYRWVGICYRWVGICYRWVGICYRQVVSV